jgi:hypothetical protein
MAFLNVVQDHGNEPDAETSEAFQKMFIAALLLTGSAARILVFMPDSSPWRTDKNSRIQRGNIWEN